MNIIGACLFFLGKVCELDNDTWWCGMASQALIPKAKDQTNRRGRPRGPHSVGGGALNRPQHRLEHDGDSDEQRLMESCRIVAKAMASHTQGRPKSTSNDPGAVANPPSDRASV